MRPHRRSPTRRHGRAGRGREGVSRSTGPPRRLRGRICPGGGLRGPRRASGSAARATDVRRRREVRRRSRSSGGAPPVCWMTCWRMSDKMAGLCRFVITALYGPVPDDIPARARDVESRTILAEWVRCKRKKGDPTADRRALGIGALMRRSISPPQENASCQELAEGVTGARQGSHQIRV
jgi:hypothetical protein